MKSTHAAALAPTLTEDYVMDAPLPQLLATTGVEMLDASITDRTFFGCFIERKDGTRVLRMPAGRSELEHDTVARYLIAQAFDIDVPTLPAPIVTTKV